MKEFVKRAADLTVRYWILLVVLGYMGALVMQTTQALSLRLVGLSVPWELVVQTSATSVIRFSILALLILFGILSFIFLPERYPRAGKFFNILSA